MTKTASFQSINEIICTCASWNMHAHIFTVHTHKGGHYLQQRVYQCFSSLFTQGGAQTVLNDLYCPSLLIEHQLKFPSSLSGKYRHIL